MRQLHKALQRFRDAQNNDKGPICHLCKGTECYELSIQEGYLVKNYLQDIDGFLCIDCYEFMVKTGKWYSYLQIFILKILIKFRHDRTQTK